MRRGTGGTVIGIGIGGGGLMGTRLLCCFFGFLCLMASSYSVKARMKTTISLCMYLVGLR